jgi:hypothetical protein
VLLDPVEHADSSALEERTPGHAQGSLVVVAQQLAHPPVVRVLGLLVRRDFRKRFLVAVRDLVLVGDVDLTAVVAADENDAHPEFSHLPT